MKKALILLTFLIKTNYMMKVPTKTDYSTYTWHTYAYELSPLSPPVPSYFNLRDQYNSPPFGFNAPAQQQQSESNLHENHQQTQGIVYPGTNFEDSSLNRASRNYRTSSGNGEALDYHLQTRETERQTHVPGERKFADHAIIYPQPHDAPAFSSKQQDPPREQQGNVQSRNTPPKKNDIVGHNCVFNLCENASDYPEDVIAQQLSKSRQFDSFFNNTLPTLTSKVFGGPENLCSSTQNTTFPRSAVNTKLVKRYIANVGEYKQGVTVETCNNADKECMFGENFPLEYKTVCVQRYTTVPLVAFDDDKNLLVESFESPSCCVCMYKPINKDEKCMFSENVPSQYTLTCEQRFTVIPLVTYDDDEKLLVESFESPSCCVCMYKIAP